MTVEQQFGAGLRKLRKQKVNHTMEMIAKDMKTSERRVRRIEDGEVRTRLSDAIAWAEYYGTTIEKIMNGEI